MMAPTCSNPVSTAGISRGRLSLLPMWLVIQLLVVLLVLLQVAGAVGGGGGEEGEDCSIHNLVDSCPDDTVNQQKIQDDYCANKGGADAATCYMEYLCVYHNQEAVNRHQLCLEMTNCASVSQVQPLDCSTWEVAPKEREEDKHNSGCTIPEIADACGTGEDDNEDADDLKSQCQQNSRGIHAAKCYMGYLCEHGGEEAVIRRKNCLDSQCPLAKNHLPPSDCSESSWEDQQQQQCNIHNLVDSCPDDSVNQQKLENQYCSNKEGADASYCYMEYLCVYHNQDVVDRHKLCLDAQCVSEVTQIPVLDCSTWEVAPQQREEGKHNTGCTIGDIADACGTGGADSDEDNDSSALQSQCQQNSHGIHAAKCYMGYLCDHHGEEAILRRKKCLDSQCPLAHHLPPLKCSKSSGGEGEQVQKPQQQEKGKEEQEQEQGTTAAPAPAEVPATSNTNNNSDDPAGTEGDGGSDEVQNSQEKEKEKEEQEQEHDAAPAPAPSVQETNNNNDTATTMSKGDNGGSKQESDGGGSGIGLRLILMVVVVAVVGGLFLFCTLRDRRRYTKAADDIVLQNLYSTQLELSDHDDDNDEEVNFTNGEDTQTTVYRD